MMEAIIKPPPEVAIPEAADKEITPIVSGEKGKVKYKYERSF